MLWMLAFQFEEEEEKRMENRKVLIWQGDTAITHEDEKSEERRL